MSTKTSIHFRVTDPNKVLITAEITMTLEEWTKLKDQLRTDYPSWLLGSEISHIIKYVHEHFYERHEDEQKQ